MTYRFSVPGIAGGNIGLQGAINDANNIPMPLLQAPQKTGLLGINQRLEGLATNPLFNMGIGMLGSQSPHLGGSIADGGRQLQSGVMLKERMKDQSSNREYRNKMLEFAKQRANQRRMVSGADGYQYYEDGSRVLPNVNAPQVPQLSNMFDKAGNIIGQQDPITGKITPVNLARTTNTREMYKGADGYNYWLDSPTERVNPNIQSTPKTTKPSKITMNLPDGGQQDFLIGEDGSLKPFGVPKANNSLDKEKRQAWETITRVEDSLNRYRNDLETIGTEIWPGKDKLQLQGSYRDLLLEMKELYNLGVLNGPDLEIMESILKDPTSISGNFYGGQQVANQLDQVVVPKLQAARQRYEQTYGGAPTQGQQTQAPQPSKQPSSDPLGLFE